MDKYATGIKGEISAKKFLVDLGYVIVDENVNFPNVGELDIVAKDGNVLVFVEVRTRADARYGNPLETITKAKINRIVKASRRYLSDKKIICGGYRYDVIGILNDNVTHIKNAFFARWN